MIDLSLYLITSSKNLSRGATVESTVKEAIRAGVTTVQLREKELSTHLFIKRAQALRKICQAPVKLIINDRIDIALACGADGVHLGQEDMPIEFARKILGDKAIIGVSVSTIDEARSAVEQGASYLGVGTCWSTNTKPTSDNKVIGPRGVKAIRDELIRSGRSIPLVVIGGINSNNLIRTLYGCISSQIYDPRKTQSAIGVAVVSAIMGSKDPYQDTQRLKKLIQEFEDWLKIPRSPGDYHLKPPVDTSFSNTLSRLMKNTSKHLVHHITNTVVQNDCANLTLAYGCSPLMSSDVNEVEELITLQPGSLVINLGTFNNNQFEAMKLAGRRANLIGKPIIFDPVGVGASQERKNKANELLNHIQVSVIKGNQAEIATLAKLNNTGVSSRGVDAEGEVNDPDKLVQNLARQELCVVVMTGEIDWISDGKDVFELENGVKELACITGTGCMIGTSIACFASNITQKHDRDSEFGLLSCMGDIQHKNMGQIVISSVLGLSLFNILAEVIQLYESSRGPQHLKIKIIDRIQKARSKQENLWHWFECGWKISFDFDP